MVSEIVVPIELMKSSDGDSERTYGSREEAYSVVRARLELIASKHRIQKVNSVFLADLANQVIKAVKVVAPQEPATVRQYAEDEVCDDGYAATPSSSHNAPIPFERWVVDMTQEVHLDFSDEKYIGNRGLVLASEFAQCFLPQLKSIAFANSALYSNISSPTAIDGNKTLELMAHHLQGHPSLESIDASRNSLGTRSYVILSRFLKETPSVTRLDVSGTLLSEGEVRHLNIIVEGNQAKKNRAANKREAAAAAAPTNEPANSAAEGLIKDAAKQGVDSKPPPPTARFFSELQMKTLLARDPPGGSGRPGDYASNLGEALPMSTKDSYRRHEVDFAIGKGKKHGGSPFAFAIHPTQRLYVKPEATRLRLASLIRESPQFNALVQEAFPPIEAKASQTTAALIALRKTLNVGLSLAEQEQINLELKQEFQKEAICMFIVDSLQRSDFRIGGEDILVEVGDMPLWVGILESPSSCAIVASKKGTESNTVVTFAKYPAGTFFGDMEIIQSIIAPSARPNRVATLQVEESGLGGSVVLRESSHSMTTNSSFIAATPTSNAIEAPQEEMHLEGDDVATTWFLSRDLYVRIFVPFLAARRKRYLQLIEEMPGIYGVPHMAKLCLSEIVEEFNFDPNERFERDCMADPSLKRKYAIEMRRASYPIFDSKVLSTHLLVVVAGRVCLKKGVSELMQFNRGSIINVLEEMDPNTGMSSRKGVILESAPVAMQNVNLLKIKREYLRQIPVELRAALDASGSTFRGAGSQ